MPAVSSLFTSAPLSSNTLMTSGWLCICGVIIIKMSLDAYKLFIHTSVNELLMILELTAAANRALCPFLSTTSTCTLPALSMAVTLAVFPLAAAAISSSEATWCVCVCVCVCVCMHVHMNSKKWHSGVCIKEIERRVKWKQHCQLVVDAAISCMYVSSLNGRSIYNVRKCDPLSLLLCALVWAYTFEVYTKTQSC